MPYRDGYLHYVDEGQGPTVLLLHGNPTWSYLYRNVIRELRGECRLVALDYPGIGMSKAPSRYGFTPQEHAEAVQAFIHGLELTDFVLVVQDWGGPIGLELCRRNRDNLRGLVLMNTWAWPATLPAMKMFSMAMGGWPLGYWLQTRRNFFASKIVPHGIYPYGERHGPVAKSLHRPVPYAAIPKTDMDIPRYIRKARPWLAEIESRLPALNSTGANSVGFEGQRRIPASEMEKWQRYLKLHETEALEDASHYVQEDRPIGLRPPSAE